MVKKRFWNRDKHFHGVQLLSSSTINCAKVLVDKEVGEALNSIFCKLKSAIRSSL